MVLIQDHKMHPIQVPLVQPPNIIWPDTRLCCEWGYYEIHTTSLCPSLDLWIFLSHLAFSLPLVLWFGGAFPWFQIRAKRGNVEELHFILNVSMKITVVLKHQMFLQIFNTKLCA